MATGTESDKLIRKRGSLKAKVTNFCKFLSSLEAEYPDKKVTNAILINELEDRSERFNNILEEFDVLQSEIDILSNDNDKQLEERETFEREFYAANARSKVLCRASIGAFEGGAASMHSVETGPGSRVGHVDSNIKLPTIQLPKFEGNYDSWLEYRDLFDSLIHQNDHISEIQKFHYLRASLSQGALEIIASLEFSSQNYLVAWDLVCKRYNNTRILVQNHVKALFSLEKLTHESSQALRKTIDNVLKHLRALKVLEEPTENWDTLVIHLVAQKLDSETAREWEQKKAVFERPTLQNLQDFLKERADILESIENNQQKRIIPRKLETKTKSFVSSSSNILVCSFCKKDHFTQECPNFLKLSVNDRIAEVKKLRLCLNCLRFGHLIKQCRSSSCKQCKGRHHSLLHIEIKAKPSENKTETAPNNSSIVCSSKNVNIAGSQVLLSTVLVNVFDNNNQVKTARALLDSGSQSCFITSRLAKDLNLDLSSIEIKVCGLNQTQSSVNKKTDVHIQSKYNNFRTKVSCLVVPEITGPLPNLEFDRHSLVIPENIQLADPYFYRPDKIDILLGADNFWQVMCVGQIKIDNHGAVLQKSKFGWIISGSVSFKGSRVVNCNFSSNLDIDQQLARFWEVEEICVTKPLSQEEKLCESEFINTVQRNEQGQFIVSIPLKENPDLLGDTYDIAKKRLFSLERKFRNNPTFKNAYVKFINEYISLGHMYKVPEDDSAKIVNFLPHHGVFKSSSLSTKLRVVFDASCISSSGYSFNDLQMVGPTIQPELFSALIRFRQYNFVIASDVEKMYRMCLVNPSQRSLQRILWRESPDCPIDTYELATVTYGCSSASFLAIRCLFQTGLDCSVDMPLISHIIKNHFYVDDFLTGAETIEKTIFIANSVSQVLEGYGFKLRKWISNSPEVLAGISSSQYNIHTLDFGAHENTKTLGLMWKAQSDSLGYSINDNFSKQITKRTILSESSQIFDPLGLLSASTILAKILLQDLWSEKVSWDESLPNHLQTRWLQLRNEFSAFNNLNINRQITSQKGSNLELHGYSDASMRAFGACVYLRSQASDGSYKISLISAKSKVAPLKTQTIPRLELMAALLLVQLMNKVANSLDLPIERILYWCDSTVVLGWLKTSPNLLQPFVANRVARIQEQSDIDNWRHVPTADNPADHVSRGVMPSTLCSLDLYWIGPEWLAQEEATWPSLPSFEIELPEMRKIVKSLTGTVDSSFLYQKYSDLSKLERVVAYCLRFKDNCFKKETKRNFGPLSYLELTRALLKLAKLSQIDSFSNEIDTLMRKNTIKKGQIVKLSPFLDENNIIRVGGRLSQSNFSYQKKHPILLSSKHPFTKLLFQREHIRLLHSGPQQLLFHIRERFWPLSARDLARKTVYQCIPCFRAKPQQVTPIMGNLPKNRVSPAPPFFTTGVDYCGPFLVKDRKTRGAKVRKAYISLFICFVTRAVHLELVSDLTTDAFIAALRRFIARRGKPSHMYSDNGTNFTGASSELKQLGEFLKSNHVHLSSTIESEGITWSFIPAHSPHFGGLWEAGVKSAKHHLKRVAGNVALTFESLTTLLAQIEAVLNSRPISPLSADPFDLSPLTPSHFLIGRPMTSAADPDLLAIPSNRLDHYQQLQQLQQHFWARWSLEYISELQQKQKWSKPSNRQLRVNDLVLIKDDNQPPLKWNLGRITALHPGTDGVARVATIKTSHGTMKRSFAKLCPLPPLDSDVQCT